MSMAMLQKQFEVIDDTVDGMALLIELAEASRNLVRYAVDLWLMTSIVQREARLMQADITGEISEAGPNQPIDPDDHLSDRLLDTQRRVHTAIDRLDQLDHIARRIDFIHRWLVRCLNKRTRKNLLSAHEIYGWMRTQIMEHDADCSPIVGSFDNADDLIAALRK